MLLIVFLFEGVLRNMFPLCRPQYESPVPKLGREPNAQPTLGISGVHGRGAHFTCPNASQTPALRATWNIPQAYTDIDD